MTVVVDSSALIALVRGERGSDMVADAMPEALASSVILAECLGKLAVLGFDAALVRNELAEAGLVVASFGEADIGAVVALHGLAARNVSLADRFCLALALDRQLPVLTADRPWATLGLPLDLRFIR